MRCSAILSTGAESCEHISLSIVDYCLLPDIPTKWRVKFIMNASSWVRLPPIHRGCKRWWIRTLEQFKQLRNCTVKQSSRTHLGQKTREDTTLQGEPVDAKTLEDSLALNNSIRWIFIKNITSRECYTVYSPWILSKPRYSTKTNDRNSLMGHMFDDR